MNPPPPPKPAFIPMAESIVTSKAFAAIKFDVHNKSSKPLSPTLPHLTSITCSSLLPTPPLRPLPPQAAGCAHYSCTAAQLHSPMEWRNIANLCCYIKLK